MPLKPAMYSITHLKNEILIVNPEKRIQCGKKTMEPSCWTIPENGHNQNILTTISVDSHGLINCKPRFYYCPTCDV